ncbi:MAG: ABC transporter permease [Chromatiales bacterium]|jgi:general nucleoside transport system permease protein|nr:ABC transporter permease [Chromatiales bacterium]
MRATPAWLSFVALPLLNVTLAFAIAGCIVWLVGEDPVRALDLLVLGAFGSQEAIGYTLYYATSLIFAGLAVAIAFHAGLFNIGGEGQAYVGGLGVTLVVLALDDSVPGVLLIPLAIVAGAACGALWGFVPGYLQARRGSHIVITTIMFNFLASAMMVYLVVNVLIMPGQMTPHSREFAGVAWLPFAHDLAASVGLQMESSPLNASLLLALASCLVFWVFVWHTRWGYALRAVGHAAPAAAYAGIDTGRVVMGAMALSGALAGLLAVNALMGVTHRLMLDFTDGFGFTGIAVALMGRNHPVGIVAAALLFGMLYQGGAELAFDMPAISRDLVVVIQGLVILFSGALEQMLRRPLERAFAWAASS